jgi:hypothetical protein
MATVAQDFSLCLASQAGKKTVSLSCSFGLSRLSGLTKFTRQTE